jgi:hypothetical protein
MKRTALITSRPGGRTCARAKATFMPEPPGRGVRRNPARSGQRPTPLAGPDRA